MTTRSTNVQQRWRCATQKQWLVAIQLRRLRLPQPWPAYHDELVKTVAWVLSSSASSSLPVFFAANPRIVFAELVILIRSQEINHPLQKNTGDGDGLVRKIVRDLVWTEWEFAFVVDCWPVVVFCLCVIVGWPGWPSDCDLLIACRSPLSTSRNLHQSSLNWFVTYAKHNARACMSVHLDLWHTLVFWL